MKVFVSSKEVSCFTPTQGDNKAEVKNTYDGYWPLTFQLEMPLIPLKKQGRGGGKVEIKMNWTDFSSKNPRSRQMWFSFLSNDEMSKVKKKRSTIQSKDENHVRRSEPHAWAPLAPLAQHFTSHKPLGEWTARTTWRDLLLGFVVSLCKQEDSCHPYPWFSDFTSSYLPSHSRHTGVLNIRT